MRKLLLLISICLLSCQTQNNSNNYLDYSERSDRFSGGVKIIPINNEVRMKDDPIKIPLLINFLLSIK